MSIIATREPIWLEFGATAKIAHANFSFATPVTWMTDPLSPVWLHILHMVAINLTVPLSFPIDSFGSILFWWEKKKPLASWPIQSSGSVGVGDFLAERVLHKYNAPVVMLSRLSHNPYSMSVRETTIAH